MLYMHIMRITKQDMQAVLMGLVLVGAIIATGAAWADTPIVYTSWQTKKCVSVTSWGGVYSCNNLPRKYIHKWVK